MEGLRDLQDIAYPQDFACSVDLAQGYYHLELHPSSRTYHGFCWEGHWYTYQVLPFGLQQALQVSTTVTTLPNIDPETLEDSSEKDSEPEE